MGSKLLVSTPVDMEGQELSDSILDLPTIKAFPEEPIVSRPGMLYYDGYSHSIKYFDGTIWRNIGKTSWGEIDGDLSDQADLSLKLTELQTEIDKRDILPTKIPNKFLHVSDDGILEWITGGGGGSTVSYAPIRLGGEPLGKIIIDDEAKTIYGPVTSGFLMLDGSRPMTGALDMNGRFVKNVSMPAEGTDATNKNYVDMRVQVPTQSTTAQTAFFLKVGDDEYKFPTYSGMSMLTCRTGTISVACPSRTATLNVLGYIVTMYAKPSGTEIVINGMTVSPNDPVDIGPYQVAATYSGTTFEIYCPMGSTIYQEQLGEESVGTTITALNTARMEEVGKEYGLNYPDALNYFDELIVCLEIPGIGLNMQYDRFLFKPSRYINKTFVDMYSHQGYDNNIALYFTSNGPSALYDQVRLVQSTNVVCIGIYGKKYGKVNMTS